MQRRVGSHAAVRSHNPTPPGLSGIVNQEVRILPSSVAPKIQPLLDSAKPLVLHVQWLVVPQLGKPLERSTTTPPPPPSTTSPVHILTGEFLGWLFSFSLFLMLIIHFLFIYLFIFRSLSQTVFCLLGLAETYKQQTDHQAVCMSWHFFWPHSFSYVLLLNGQKSLPVAFGLFSFSPL
ncbi:hypothetical protein BDV41DRAFT_108126 [Aspergillus transmontanensis]|uniref:Uncharacterized protein n=1 Tax=Aspergillus transmontanensis TaxID=1034304 RepID=A0A5N6VE54_9EURO|nr:hypothetical protein BDV41DRAFT_108126 [Aspergillus transmontanensis]